MSKEILSEQVQHIVVTQSGKERHEFSALKEHGVVKIHLPVDEYNIYAESTFKGVWKPGDLIESTFYKDFKPMGLQTSYNRLPVREYPATQLVSPPAEAKISRWYDQDEGSVTEFFEYHGSGNTGGFAIVTHFSNGDYRIKTFYESGFQHMEIWTVGPRTHTIIRRQDSSLNRYEIDDGTVVYTLKFSKSRKKDPVEVDISPKIQMGNDEKKFLVFDLAANRKGGVAFLTLTSTNWKPEIKHVTDYVKQYVVDPLDVTDAEESMLTLMFPEYKIYARIPEEFRPFLNFDKIRGNIHRAKATTNEL